MQAIYEVIEMFVQFHYLSLCRNDFVSKQLGYRKYTYSNYYLEGLIYQGFGSAWTLLPPLWKFQFSLLLTL